jgi:hypothetical protein
MNLPIKSLNFKSKKKLKISCTWNLVAHFLGNFFLKGEYVNLTKYFVQELGQFS